jgi:hypothetical protein
MKKKLVDVNKSETTSVDEDSLDGNDSNLEDDELKNLLITEKLNKIL